MQATHEKMYAAKFAGQMRESFSAQLIGEDELNCSGLSMVPLQVRMDYIGDLSPSEFESRSEYDRVVALCKQKESSLIVIDPSEELVAILNYKGEQIKWGTKQYAASLPVFEGKMQAYELFVL